MAKLTLFSVYSYLNNHNINLFESFSAFPEDIDVDAVAREILIRGGEFGVVYADVDFMKMAVDNWTKKWLHTIERWNKIQNEDYNPLHNYDRHEIYTDTTNETASGSGTSGGEDHSDNVENRNSYDSATLQPIASAHNDSTSSLTSTSESTLERGLTHDAHLYGNIGVTTSSQLQIEARSAERWALYENIAGLFISEFCIPVYT